MYQRVKCFIRTGLLFSLAACIWGPVAAQQKGVDSIAKELQKVQEVYKKAGPMSFQIKYTYANETTPNTILDSLYGNVYMDENKYRVIVDNTETIQTGKFVILLFKEDKIMYIAKPTTGNSNVISPVATVDSLFAHIKGVTGDITESSGYKTISFSFPEGMKYKKMSFTIDRRNNYIVSVTYVVKTEQLMDPLTQKDAYDKKLYSQYAIVKAGFSRYTAGKVNEALLNEATFFTRQGAQFTTTDQYKEYKIFIGTPNL